MKPLSAATVQRQLRRLEGTLGRADAARLTTLVGELREGGTITLAAALAALFPDHAGESSLASLRQLRHRLARVATAAEVRLELCVDSKKRSPPSDRTCWFEGTDPGAEAALTFSMEAIRPEAERSRVGQLGVAVARPGDSAHGTLRLAVLSPPFSECASCSKLVELLTVRLTSDRTRQIEVWSEAQILSGESPTEERKQAVARADIVVVLLAYDSTAFLASLDSLLPGSRAPIIPVLMQPIHAETLPTCLQDYRAFPEGRAGLASFGDCKGRPQQDRFAHSLVEEIQRLLGRGGPPDWPAQVRALTAADFEERHRAFIQAKGHTAWVRKSAEAALEQNRAQAVDAMAHLERWALDPNGEPYFALLGEYGIGKTTTCETLAYRLCERHREGTGPLAIYLDLRNLGKLDPTKLPTLEEIVERTSRGTWRSLEPLPGSELLRLVRSAGAMVIFDGLDEVLVHLDTATGQRFTRELWRVLPPTASPDGRGKVLVSCRSHYFRTLREQWTHFLGEEREGITEKHYQAFLLLPFDEGQIRAYLEHNLPGRDPDQLLELIGSVHNLGELAERPYLLSLLAREIDWIESARARGETVSGVSLYRHMVRSCLERDTGKHVLQAEHKLRLMERLAAAMWRSGEPSWPISRLEDWLVDELAANQRLAFEYTGKVDLVKEDVRTATFLVRPGEEDFRFSHTSLQEFFLASHLCRALVEGDLEAWDLGVPSRETLDFLGQLLAEEKPRDEALASLRALRDAPRGRGTLLAFRYAMLARPAGYPAPALAGWRLDGADLRGLELVAPADGPRLDLRGLVLRDARLEGARFEHLDLEGACFERADLVRAELLDCRAVRSSFAGANLRAATLREVDLERVDFEGTTTTRARWLFCKEDPPDGARPGFVVTPTMALPRHLESPTRRLEPHRRSAFLPNTVVVSPDGLLLVSAGSGGDVTVWDPRSGELLRSLGGHQGWVNSCAFSPDGALLASAGDDGSVKLWHPHSGELLRSLGGHQGSVNSCAFSPDGALLASAGHDSSVKLWDPQSGELLRSLEGHQGWASSCAFYLDRALLASAGGDGAIKLWDPHSGELLRSLEGDQGWVTSCAFSPDGALLASAGDYGSVKLWDPQSGELLRSLEGHQGSVNSCAFSPDGALLASAGEDRAVKLWDPHSGELVRSLEGDQGWVSSCAFSPDGALLASAGQDGSVKLWDPHSGGLLRSLEGHQGWVRSCAFSLDGAILASAGSDGAVKLWDPHSGELLRSLEGDQGWVTSCAFSPGGALLASAGDDATLRRWDIATLTELPTRIALLPGGEHAVLRTDGSGAVEASVGAWRWLGWSILDPESGCRDLYPAELFGPLPEPKALMSQPSRHRAERRTQAAGRQTQPNKAS